MKLVMASADGRTLLGALEGRRIIDLGAAMRACPDAATRASTAIPESIEALLHAGEDAMEAARAAFAWAARQPHEARDAQGRRLGLDQAEARLELPIGRPQKIIGIGINYHDHCRDEGRPPPTKIVTFGMFANALTGPGQAIILPADSDEMDYEAELVVVIGKRGRRIRPENALDHVAGYTAGNDVSARNHQRADPQTMRGKFGDTHAPIGPCVVTRDEIADVQDLAIELRVNGVVRQRSSTREMVFPVSEIIAFLSGFVTLEPGDLIFTGTPARVVPNEIPYPWLRPGDRVEVEIGGIGVLSNPCVAETA